MAESVITIQKVTIKQGLLRVMQVEAHPYSLSVYLAICAYSKDNKTSQVSLRVLVNKTGLAKATVFRCIKGLERVKIIKKLQSKNGRTQIYLLLGNKWSPK